ncbi:MAG: XRE family transcriptional regulator [Alphaproteobacteria bacterium]|nr:XRE family transcriptional regulator [Alphaproteobacteria bacterium]
MSKQFNGQLLALARQVRRLSQAELVEKIGSALTQGTLSKIEHGRVQPSEELVGAFSSALKLKSSFFFDGAYVREPMVSYHRKRQKLTARDLDALYGIAEVYRLNIRRCLESVEVEATLPSLPAIDPDQYERQVEEIAAAVRQRWQVPRGPIKDLTKLVEDSGVIIVPFNFGTPLIDGFCQHKCDGLPPLVFINNQQPKDRYRFSLAHEVGHLVMHHTPHPEQEIEANRFASELLMPSKEIAHDFYDLSLKKFMELKLYWGTSMQALIYKAWQVGRLDDRMFKYYNVEMSKRGFRKREPVEASHLAESPATIKWIMEAHVGDLGYTINDLSDIFGLEEDELREMFPVDRPKPRLRLIVNQR